MDANVIFATINSAIRSTTPILMAALASGICNRSGVFNVALEGQMLIGCFVSIVINWYTHSLLLAVLGGVIAGGLIGWLVGVLQVRYKAADLVVGTSINLFVGALTAILLSVFFNVRGSFKDPALLSLTKVDIPLVNKIPYLSVLFRNLTWLDYLAYVIAIAMTVYLFKTVSGYHLLSVGVKKEAAESMGIRSQRLQIGSVLFSGLLCGYGGVVLAMGQVTMFTEGMTSGRGFVGMAAGNLGASHPGLTILSSLFFGFCESFANIAQNRVPSQLTRAVPYIATVLALIVFGWRARHRERLKVRAAAQSSK